MEWTLEHGMIVRRFGDGPELVWIHGLGEWSASFDPVARRMPGFTHVLVDLPGYGRSPWPAQVAAGDSLDALANHVAAWLSARLPAIVIGHSMGGMLAIMIAERASVRGMVNVDGNLTGDDCTFSRDASKYSAADFAERGFAAIRDDVYRRGIDDRALRGYYAALSAASPAVFYRNALDLVAAAEREDLLDRMVGLRVPHLYIAGGLPGGICQRSRELLDERGARWMTIEPSGHWVFVDRPDAFAAAASSFAREIR